MSSTRTAQEGASTNTNSSNNNDGQQFAPKPPIGPRTVATAPSTSAGAGGTSSSSSGGGAQQAPGKTDSFRRRKEHQQVAIQLLLRDSKNQHQTTPHAPASGAGSGEAERKRYRTKQLLKKVHNIRTTGDLEEEEACLREVVLGNEERRRNQWKLHRLTDIRQLNERQSLDFHQCEDRVYITDEEEQLFQSEMGFFAVVCGEATARNTIEKMYPPQVLTDVYIDIKLRENRMDEARQRINWWLPLERVQREELLNRCYLAERFLGTMHHSRIQCRSDMITDEERITLESQRRYQLEVSEIEARDSVQEELLQALFLLHGDAQVAARVAFWNDVQGHERNRRHRHEADEIDVRDRIKRSMLHARYALEVMLANTRMQQRERIFRQDLEANENSELQAILARVNTEWHALYQQTMEEKGPRDEVELSEAFTRRDHWGEERAERADLENQCNKKEYWISTRDYRRGRLLEEYLDGRIALGGVESRQRHSVANLNAQQLFRLQSAGRLSAIQSTEELARDDLAFESWRFYLWAYVDWALAQTVLQEAYDRSTVAAAEISGLNAIRLEFEYVSSGAQNLAQHINQCEEEESAERDSVEEQSFDAWSHIRTECTNDKVRIEIAQMSEDAKSLGNVQEVESKGRKGLNAEFVEGWKLMTRNFSEYRELAARRATFREEKVTRCVLYQYLAEEAETVVRQEQEWDRSFALWDVKEAANMEAEAIERADMMKLELERRDLVYLMRNQPLPDTIWLGCLEGDEEQIRTNIEFEGEIAVGALGNYFMAMAPQCFPNGKPERPVYKTIRENDQVFIAEKSLCELIQDRIDELEAEDEARARAQVQFDESQGRVAYEVQTFEVGARQHLESFEVEQVAILSEAMEKIGQRFKERLFTATSDVLRGEEVKTRDAVSIESRAEMLGILEQFDSDRARYTSHLVIITQGELASECFQEKNQLSLEETLQRRKIQLHMDEDNCRVMERHQKLLVEDNDLQEALFRQYRSNEASMAVLMSEQRPIATKVATTVGDGGEPTSVLSPPTTDKWGDDKVTAIQALQNIRRGYQAKGEVSRRRQFGGDKVTAIQALQNIRRGRQAKGEVFRRRQSRVGGGISSSNPTSAMQKTSDATGDQASSPQEEGTTSLPATTQQPLALLVKSMLTPSFQEDGALALVPSLTLLANQAATVIKRERGEEEDDTTSSSNENTETQPPSPSSAVPPAIEDDTTTGPHVHEIDAVTGEEILCWVCDLERETYARENLQRYQDDITTIRVELDKCEGLAPRSDGLHFDPFIRVLRVVRKAPKKARKTRQVGVLTVVDEDDLNFDVGAEAAQDDGDEDETVICQSTPVIQTDSGCPIWDSGTQTTPNLAGQVLIPYQKPEFATGDDAASNEDGAAAATTQHPDSKLRIHRTLPPRQYDDETAIRLQVWGNGDTSKYNDYRTEHGFLGEVTIPTRVIGTLYGMAGKNKRSTQVTSLPVQLTLMGDGSNADTRILVREGDTEEELLIFDDENDNNNSSENGTSDGASASTPPQLMAVPKKKTGTIYITLKAQRGNTGQENALISAQAFARTRFANFTIEKQRIKRALVHVQAAEAQDREGTANEEADDAQAIVNGLAIFQREVAAELAAYQEELAKERADITEEREPSKRSEIEVDEDSMRMNITTNQVTAKFDVELLVQRKDQETSETGARQTLEEEEDQERDGGDLGSEGKKVASALAEEQRLSREELDRARLEAEESNARDADVVKAEEDARDDLHNDRDLDRQQAEMDQTDRNAAEAAAAKDLETKHTEERAAMVTGEDTARNKEEERESDAFSLLSMQESEDRQIAEDAVAKAAKEEREKAHTQERAGVEEAETEGRATVQGEENESIGKLESDSTEEQSGLGEKEKKLVEDRKQILALEKDQTDAHDALLKEEDAAWTPFSKDFEEGLEKTRAAATEREDAEAAAALEAAKKAEEDAAAAKKAEEDAAAAKRAEEDAAAKAEEDAAVAKKAEEDAAAAKKAEEDAAAAEAAKKAEEDAAAAKKAEEDAAAAEKEKLEKQKQAALRVVDEEEIEERGVAMGTEHEEFEKIKSSDAEGRSALLGASKQKEEDTLRKERDPPAEVRIEVKSCDGVRTLEGYKPVVKILQEDGEGALEVSDIDSYAESAESDGGKFANPRFGTVRNKIHVTVTPYGTKFDGLEPVKVQVFLRRDGETAGTGGDRFVGEVDLPGEVVVKNGSCATDLEFAPRSDLTVSVEKKEGDPNDETQSDLDNKWAVENRGKLGKVSITILTKADEDRQQLDTVELERKLARRGIAIEEAVAQWSEVAEPLLRAQTELQQSAIWASATGAFQADLAQMQDKQEKPLGDCLHCKKPVYPSQSYFDVGPPPGDEDDAAANKKKDLLHEACKETWEKDQEPQCAHCKMPIPAETDFTELELEDPTDHEKTKVVALHIECEEPYKAELIASSFRGGKPPLPVQSNPEVNIPDRKPPLGLSGNESLLSPRSGSAKGLPSPRGLPTPRSGTGSVLSTSRLSASRRSMSSVPEEDREAQVWVDRALNLVRDEAGTPRSGANGQELTETVDGKTYNAKAALNEALRLRPQYHIAWYSLGVLLAEEAYQAAATERSKSGGKISDYNVNVTYRIGEVDYSEADCYANCLQFEPAHVAAWFDLATYLEGHPEISALNIAGKSWRAQDCYAMVCDCSIDEEERAQAFTILLTLLKENDTVTISEKKMTNADCGARALRINASSAQTWFDFGQCRLKKKYKINGVSYSSSQPCFAMAAGLDPTMYQAWAQLAASLPDISENDLPEEYVEVGEGNKVNGVMAYTKALELNDTDPSLWYNLALLIDGLPAGDTTRVVKNLKGKPIWTQVELFAKVASLDNRNADAWYALASAVGEDDVIAVEGLDDKISKIQCYMYFLQLKPDSDHIAWYNLGVNLGDKKTAKFNDQDIDEKFCYMRAVAISPEDNPNAWYNLGVTLKDDESVRINGKTYTRQECLDFAEEEH